MLSQHSWHRPPVLDLQSDKADTLAVPSDGLLAAGALSPDVQPNSPPLFIPGAAGAAPPSLLKIGNYLLTERLPDMTAGIEVYSAVHVETGEKFICRVSYICSTLLCFCEWFCTVYSNIIVCIRYFSILHSSYPPPQVGVDSVLTHLCVW